MKIHISHLIQLSMLLLFLGCGKTPKLIDNDTPDNTSQPPIQTEIKRDDLIVQTLVGALSVPWDMAMDRDGNLWITERQGTISVIDTTTKQKREIGRINSVLQQGESGLMGLVLHPNFPSTPFIYVVYSYNAGGNSIKNRLTRFTYNGQTLSAEQMLLENIPGSFNHNGARLAIGPDNHIYISTGDAEGPNQAVDLQSLAGKILRITLDGLVPSANPFATELYSFGHRNPQGLVFHPETHDLYITEHGTTTNDEVNLVVMGRNHGWPEALGFCDNDLHAAEMQYCRENDVIEPVITWTPTIAPAGADFYYSDAIVPWKGSLLFATLKGQALYRLQLSSDGKQVVDQEILFEGEFGRLRDVLVGPRGEIYLATSNRDGRGQITGSDRIIQISLKKQ